MSSVVASNVAAVSAIDIAWMTMFYYCCCFSQFSSWLPVLFRPQTIAGLIDVAVSSFGVYCCFCFSLPLLLLPLAIVAASIGRGWVVLETPDSQSREAGFESSSCVSKLGQFRSLHVVPLHSAV